MRRFRKIITMAVAGMLVASILGGCSGKEKLQITGNTYPYLLQAEKNGEVTESEATLYFIDGGDIPYVKLSEYMPMLSDIYRGVKMGDIGFEVKKDSYHYVVTRDDNGNLYSLELKCGGSVRIVTRDVDASADVLIRFVSPSDHVIPSAVVKTLLHADEAA